MGNIFIIQTPENVISLKMQFWFKTNLIDLFRLYILFSRYRSCDDTQEIWSFVLFIKKSIFMLAFILHNEQDKGSNLLSIITWPVLGEQNVQAKKVYSENEWNGQKLKPENRQLAQSEVNCRNHNLHPHGQKVEIRLGKHQDSWECRK